MCQSRSHRHVDGEKGRTSKKRDGGVLKREEKKKTVRNYRRVVCSSKVARGFFVLVVFVESGAHLIIPFIV